MRAALHLARFAALAALTACGAYVPGDPTPSPTGSEGAYITCDDVIQWRANYAELGTSILDEDRVDPLPDPDPTPWIGQLICPPPYGYYWDDHSIVVNLYWSSEPPDAALPDAATGGGPDAWVYADGAIGPPPHDGGYPVDLDGRPDDVDAGPGWPGYPDAGVDADWTLADANWGYPDAAPSWADGPTPCTAQTDHPAYAPSDCPDAGPNPNVFAPPQGKAVEARPVTEPKPPGTPPVTEIPLPAGAQKPGAKIVVEPANVRPPTPLAVGVRYKDPNVAIADTARPEYRARLWREVTQLEPAMGVRDTQVHMGYWSNKDRGNYDALINLLKDINTNGGATNRAFFDEGINPDKKLPAYDEVNVQQWYDRGKLPLGRGSYNDGTKFIDPFPTRFFEADLIWGQYSVRYTQLALDVVASTGKPVDCWCFIDGAAVDRVFYKYELPALKDLEALGYVRVHFAKTVQAKWTNPGDWIHGTANAPPPGPAVNPPPFGPP